MSDYLPTSRASSSPAAAGVPFGTLGSAKLGLVLAGGGAKGAYQVGVIQALGGAGTRISAVAGASIGALNGAIVAASPDLRTAGKRLEAVWRRVASRVDDSIERLSSHAGQFNGDDLEPANLARVLELIDSPIRTRGFLESVLRQAVDEDDLRHGRPLWVSVTPPGSAELTEMPAGWLIDWFVAKAGDPEMTWIHVNDRFGDLLYDTILASAALPFAFPARIVGGRLLRDGGVTDNCPAYPLVKWEKCQLIIVVHLKGDDLWDASRFMSASVIEIRPSGTLDPPGQRQLSWVAGLLDFSTARVQRLIEHGRQDAERALDLLHNTLGTVVDARDSFSKMVTDVDALRDDRT